MKKSTIISLCLAGCTAFAISASVYAETEEKQKATETIAETEEATETEKTVELEEATESKETAKTEKKVKSDTSSDDVYSFSVKVGDVSYQFPMSYAEFMEKGEWEITKYYEGSENNILKPDEYTYLGLSKDGNEITAYVINFDINEAAVSDCYVGGIEIDGEYDFDAETVEILMPGEIKVGVSTMEDIQAAYGSPNNTYEGDSYTKVTYEKDYYNYVELYVYNDSQVLKTIEIRNFTAPENYVYSEVSKEIPEAAANYKTPEALTDDYTDPIVKYFGDLYRLPAPVSAFIANGWTIDGIEEGDYVKGNGFAAVNMTKDNQNEYFYLYNLSGNATAYENCMICDLGFHIYDSEVINMKLSGGVTLGADADELMAAAKEKGYYVEDDMENGYLTIAKTENDRWNNKVEFWINTEESAVAIAGFEISYKDIVE